MHTAHIADFYWSKWIASGGRHGFDHWDRFVPLGGNYDWFNKYYRECEACAMPGACFGIW